MEITAAVLREKGKPFIIEDLELDSPRPDEILVEMAGTGVCHTDLFFSHNPLVLPQVLGHEGAGIVLEAGSDVTKVAPGDHVVLTFYSCGTCTNCRQGHPAYCSRSAGPTFSGARPDGSTTMKKEDETIHGSFFAQSSFATHALAMENNVVKITTKAPLELMGPMGCGVQTGAGAVMNCLKPRAGSSIAIFGMGTVGLSAVMAAKIVGCKPIVGIDIHPERLKIAAALGATHTIDATKGDPVTQIQKITRGGADFALESAGSEKVAAQAVNCTHRLGKCGILGATPMGTRLSLDMNAILFGRTVFGIIEGDSIPDLFIPKLIDLFLDSCFPMDQMIRFYPLSQINQAVEDMMCGKAIKPVLKGK